MPNSQYAIYTKGKEVIMYNIPNNSVKCIALVGFTNTRINWSTFSYASAAAAGDVMTDRDIMNADICGYSISWNMDDKKFCVNDSWDNPSQKHFSNDSIACEVCTALNEHVKSGKGFFNL